ncbi:MAG: OB-fold putative lipoprotein [Deltaproteobacteria bacterium]|jgi:hypothetical protein|nr:OB-fold putative lipoprotein [Deltaproteobacteria bacterium]
MFSFIVLNIRKKVFWISLILFFVSLNAISDHALAEDAVYDFDTMIRISSTELFDAYNNNEVAADMKYKGQYLYVDGPISGISKDFFGSVVIELGTKRLFGVVMCHYDKEMFEVHEEGIATLSKGRHVTVAGIGNGMLFQMPQITKCAILAE